jgi:hypothetical protein
MKYYFFYIRIPEGGALSRLLGFKYVVKLNGERDNIPQITVFPGFMCRGTSRKTGTGKEVEK